MPNMKQSSPNQAKKPDSMRCMSFTSWHRANEDTLAPVEIECLDKRLVAACEADKNYR
jgi:hypothetical protein